MNVYRKAGVATGLLFIVATVLDVVSRVAFLTPVLGAADPLGAITANEPRVVLGALLLFVGAAAASGIAIAMYPVLRRHGETLALGSVGFRLIEGTFYLGVVVCLLLLLGLGQEAANAADPAAFAAPAALILAAREALGQVGVLAFGVGATMYYWVFYRTRLVPRWLSAWGLAAIASLMVSVALVIGGVVEPMSSAQVVLAAPIGLQEMVLAVWLVARGFRAIDDMELALSTEASPQAEVATAPTALIAASR